MDRYNLGGRRAEEGEKGKGNGPLRKEKGGRQERNKR